MTTTAAQSSRYLECRGCGQHFLGQRGLASHQSRRFIDSACSWSLRAHVAALAEDKERSKTPRVRFTVRKMTSGRTGEVSWYVYDTERKGRVSVHACISREPMQADADRLNEIEAQHARNLADPAWIANRDRILAEQEAAEQARSDAFERYFAARAAKEAK